MGATHDNAPAPNDASPICNGTKGRDIAKLLSQGNSESRTHGQCHKMGLLMILFVLLNKQKGRKLKALFYHGLTNLCNARFVAKNNYIIASLLLQASDTVLRGND